jgi:hypothetical protein
MVTLLPSAVERRVVSAVFADAQELGWETLTSTARSRQYGLWISRPDVGGALTSFMSPEAARVWLKDGPMKEYSRALNGLGKHSDLIASLRPNVAEIVRRSLGQHWEVVPATQLIKPLRVRVREVSSGAESIFAWGPSRDFKHLIWAALSEANELQEWVVCVVAPVVNATPKNVQASQTRIALRCGLRVLHLTV